MHIGLENWQLICGKTSCERTGSTISTLLHDKINPKDCQVLSLDDSGFSNLLGLFQVIMANPRRDELFSKKNKNGHKDLGEANK